MLFFGCATRLTWQCCVKGLHVEQWGKGVRLVFDYYNTFQTERQLRFIEQTTLVVNFHKRFSEDAYHIQLDFPEYNDNTNSDSSSSRKDKSAFNADDAEADI